MPTSSTDAFIKNLSVPGRYTDAATAGRNLQVKPNGGKYWTLRYVLRGKRQDVSLGAYPTVTLKEARARANDLRAQLNKGVEPSVPWRAVRQVEEEPALQIRFADYAAECIARRRPEWRNAKHAAQWTSSMQRFANPVIGEKPIDEVDMDDILKILTPIWHTRTVAAERLRGRLEWIFASAITPSDLCATTGVSR